MNRISNLARVQAELNKNGLSSLVIDGALLGLVRDGNLISWDWDAEIAILNENFSFHALEKAITSLVRLNFEIKSVSRAKYFKLNLYRVEDPDFTYSLFVLHEKNGYLLRPRFRYPKQLLVPKNVTVKIDGHEVFLPEKPELFLEFVYGVNWRTPIHSKDPNDYLSPSVFRWNFLDLAHRVLRKIEFCRIKVRRFFVSKYINRRESLFRLILKIPHSPNCHLIEIGSSDGSESLIFLENHRKSFSTIFEPRDNARAKILARIKRKALEDRIKIRSEVVVAEKGQSSNFRVVSKENLSHISEKIELGLSEDSMNEILISDLMQNFIGSPVFLKMDVEGYEIQLLQKICEQAKIHNQIVLQIELHQLQYDSLEANKLFKELLSTGFALKFLETSSHPRPLCLSELLEGSPIAISGRRALWSVTQDSSINLVPFLCEPFYVYNSFTAEAGKRAVRSIVLSKGVNFDEPKRSIKTLIWQTVLDI